MDITHKPMDIISPDRNDWGTMGFRDFSLPPLYEVHRSLPNHLVLNIAGCYLCHGPRLNILYENLKETEGKSIFPTLYLFVFGDFDKNVLEGILQLHYDIKVYQCGERLITSEARSLCSIMIAETWIHWIDDDDKFLGYAQYPYIPDDTSIGLIELCPDGRNVKERNALWSHFVRTKDFRHFAIKMRADLITLEDTFMLCLLRENTKVARTNVGNVIDYNYETSNCHKLPETVWDFYHWQKKMFVNMEYVLKYIGVRAVEDQIHWCFVHLTENPHLDISRTEAFNLIRMCVYRWLPNTPVPEVDSMLNRALSYFMEDVCS